MNSDSPELKKQQKSLALALSLAFVPSGLLLLLTLAGGIEVGASSRDWIRRAGLLALCVISVGCCGTSSFLVFRSNKLWAILFGILLMLLNAYIAFGAGCTAIWTSP